MAEGDEFFLHVERNNAKDHHHKLAQVADGPFKITKADDKTVVIERPERSVERISSARVFLAQKAKIEKAFNDILKPFKLDLEYPAREAANRPDFVKPPKPKPEDKPTKSDSASPNVDGKKKPDGNQDVHVQKPKKKPKKIKKHPRRTSL